MKPLGKFVLVSVDNTEETKLILPDSAMQRPNTGTVVSAGNKVVSELHKSVSVVFRDTFSSYPVPGDDNLVVMHEDNIMLII